jgi:hypothetical protein
MKKIYAADTLAVVVLDTTEEIEVVVDALRQYINRVQWPTDKTLAADLLGELTAPAPSW